MDAPKDAERFERGKAEFREALSRLTPVRLRTEIADELLLESAPVLETLLAALESGGPADGEALALSALLGRRVATLGETASTALAALDALGAAARAAGYDLPHPLERALRGTGMEGFAAAVDERARAAMVARGAQSLIPVVVSERVLLLVISGCDDVDSIVQALARLGRAALDADAAACIVHTSLPTAPDRDVALEIAAFESSAALIGARAIFSGTPFVTAALASHAAALTICPSFQEALRLALDAAELTLGRTSLLQRGLKRLKG